MSIPGWYPDPARQPGQFRYWDGVAWSSGTSANPADPPPRAPDGPRRPRRTGPVLVALAVVVVLAVVAFLALRPTPQTATTGPTLSARPPSAVLPSESDDPPTPTEVDPTPSGSPSSPASNQTCPEGAPDARQPHPSDGLVHGGGLAFPSLAGWSSESLPHRLSWAFDVSGQQTPSALATPGGMVAVGALSTADGFETPEQAVDLVLACMTGTGFYPGTADRRDIAAVPVSVEGFDGWRIRSVLTYGSDATPSIDLVDVIVIDLQSPESLAMFWGTAPAADQGLVRLLDRTVTRLQTD